MKKIVLSVDYSEVAIDSLDDNEPVKVVLYSRRRTDKARSSQYALLTQLESGRWGFVDIGGNRVSPTYIGNSAKDSIRRCLNSGREVLQYDSLMVWAHN